MTERQQIIERVRRRVTRKKSNVEFLISQITKLIQHDAAVITVVSAKLSELTEECKAFAAFWDEQPIEDTEGDVAADFEELDNEVFSFIRQIKDTEQKVQLKLFDLIKADKLTPAATPQLTPKTVQLRLPKIELAKFTGHFNKWQSWWLLFEAHVHRNNDVPKVTKFQYLISSLQGTAADIANNYSANDEGYDAAIVALHEFYGNANKQKSVAVERLIHLKEPSYSYASVLAFKLAIQGVINDLNYLQINVTGDAEPFVKQLIIMKMPATLKQRVYTESKNLYPSVGEMLVALATILERNDFTTTNKPKDESTSKQKWWQPYQPKSQQGKPNTYRQTQSSVEVKGSQGPRYPCIYCGQNDHPSADCAIVSTEVDRLTKLKNQGRCVKCCREGHTAKNCTTKLNPCYRCQQNHHTWRHPYQTVTASSSQITTNSLGSHSANKLNSVALPTALVTVKRGKRSQRVRAFFDQGSQRTFISQKLVDQLNITVIGQVELELAGFNMTKPKRLYSAVNANVLMGGKYYRFPAVVLDDLKTHIHTPGLTSTAKHLKKRGVRLADKFKMDIVGEVDLLVGSDNYYKVVNGQTRVDGINLLQTPAGYMVAGPIKGVSYSTPESVQNVTVCKMGCAYDPLIDRQSCWSDDDQLTQATKLWDLDIIGIQESEIAVEDSTAQDEYIRAVEYDGEKYWVNLPFKADRPVLPSNRGPALAQVKHLLQKLERDPEAMEHYSKVITSLEEMDFIEQVKEENTDKEIHYLPHHGVKKNSVTTPLRIVFNASSKPRGGVSLNDCLLKGPNLTEKLNNMLLKFRTQRYGYTADISRAFLRVGLKEEHRDYTRFLWKSDPSDDNCPLRAYRFKSVLFGATCSPFLLHATLAHHFQQTESIIKEVLANGFYVDNFVGTTNDEDKLNLIYTEANQVLASANMPLQQWASNSKSLQDLIERDDGKNMPLNVNILGVGWDIESDRLIIKNPQWSDPPTSKRQLLSEASSVFDPIGVVAPVTVRAKMIVQETWKYDLTWDDPLPEEITNKWSKVRADLMAVESLEIPRRVIIGDDRVTLHMFCDASSLAYGAAAYVVEGDNSHLLTSRCRVAPIKTRSLPQLELTALLVGSRLVKYIVETLDFIKFEDVYLWSDNESSLQWIRNNQSDLVYVKNRVAEIRKLRDEFNITLLHVPTKENPSDHLSRGLTVLKLASCELWWHGPPWLTNFQNWPIQKAHITAAEITSEGVPTVLIPPIIEVKRFASWRKLIGTTRKVFWFAKAKLDPLLTPEIYWLRTIQREHYPLIIELLQGNVTRPLSNPSRRMITDLDLYWDETTGLVKSRGRIDKASIITYLTDPVLASGDSPVIKLYIQYIHEKERHAGPSQTLSTLRQQLWVPKARPIINQIIRNCYKCNRMNRPLFLQPGPPVLPKERVTFIRPFKDVGVDYSGAIMIRDTDNHQIQRKVYICLFTCMASRAVHLEIANDMSAETFLNLFRRFVATWGIPSTVTSDNGSNFLATTDFLKDLAEEPAVIEYFQHNHLVWTFIRPRSPWEGGFYERMIGIVKKCLKTCMYRRVLNYDDIVTLLKEVMVRVNNRPMTYQTKLNEALSPLTPNHLLYGRSIESLPLLVSVEDDDPSYEDQTRLEAAYGERSKLVRKFVHVWETEYLRALREKHYTSTREHTPSVKVGDIVIRETTQQREKWPLAKVTRLLPDANGVVRAVEVLSRGNLLVCTINKLAPLEVSSSLVGADHVDSGCLGVGLKRTSLTANHEAVGDSSLVDTNNVDSGCLGVGLKRTSLTVDHEAVEDIDEITGTDEEPSVSQVESTTDRRNTASGRPQRRAARTANENRSQLIRDNLI